MGQGLCHGSVSWVAVSVMDLGQCLGSGSVSWVRVNVMVQCNGSSLCQGSVSWVGFMGRGQCHGIVSWVGVSVMGQGQVSWDGVIGQYHGPSVMRLKFEHKVSTTYKGPSKKYMNSKTVIF